MTEGPRHIHWDAKIDRDRPVRMATRYITRDEANAAALVIGAALGIAVAVILAVIAHDLGRLGGPLPATNIVTTETREGP